MTSFGLLGIFHLKKIQSDTFSQDNIMAYTASRTNSRRTAEESQTNQNYVFMVLCAEVRTVSHSVL